jgi:hypothetical protein
MQPTQDNRTINDGIADIDRAFDEMTSGSTEPTTEPTVRRYVSSARSWLAAHQIATAAIGLGLGFVVGRLVRRS